ncbi:hypothetical protein [Sporolactobacillus pectinivorans]|uniref:hypothetical protein n=1 Tax=Sporolactobacillus pectinivorans TaxID=1591408 RepID=UPI000C260042|nr:hypothetical protein [Sporolactobacillus pectinivorans]
MLLIGFVADAVLMMNEQTHAAVNGTSKSEAKDMIGKVPVKQNDLNGSMDLGEALLANQQTRAQLYLYHCFFPPKFDFGGFFLIHFIV